MDGIGLGVCGGYTCSLSTAPTIAYTSTSLSQCCTIQRLADIPVLHCTPYSLSLYGFTVQRISYPSTARRIACSSTASRITYPRTESKLTFSVPLVPAIWFLVFDSGFVAYQGMDEGQLCFPPTYKYDPGTTAYPPSRTTPPPCLY